MGKSMVQAQPFLKWAGGKRQLIPEISKYIPSSYHTYFEPFIGAGAVLFHLQPEKAIINDVNQELVNTYKVIRDHVEELLTDLRTHNNSSDYFYELRNLDRDADNYQQLSAIQKASRLIYLNKTCFNGLYRVNQKGQFNVPFGKYKNPNFINEDVIRSVHHFLNQADVEIFNHDFQEVVNKAKQGDFVYFDPPYDPVSTTSSFTNYALQGFGKEEQLRLRDLFIDLDKRGCYVLLSNSATDFIKDIYSEYRTEIVGATRNINSVGSKRGKIQEVLIMNY
ncbi:modification methylase [Alkalihalobacillus alcalophilus ATCC 27647 = CGMCC 1.3604]|uniref:Site-specific DNA-methyltransferase (adenine-specific) n=2 Tax=Alkalihalobacillus alcalophilus TaxID=1445 RepID=A0A094WH89_ALKAL|nr:DNA adenine methylase [Alkalihalobacillus alcalophilus]KGA96166.1 DNA methyltransferase [Alkalihalobacillus alcalophilus ATCC 27647 = CGMCC 1.3604]MED1564043.1 DNA adenine methylase [Alkalihalobacillus alcalophilus]THG90475.1 modification methylase [Alkalihalobacillus alcalophilus ATCC 27647 = CGMCC 1.3604]